MASIPILGNLGLNVELTEPPRVVQFKINKAIAAEANKFFRKKAPRIRQRIVIQVVSSIRESLTVQESINGRLRHELGLTNPTTKWAAILDMWARGVKVTHKRVTFSSTGIKGGFSIEMIRQDWQDVLSLPEAKFVAEGGSTINWLQWLLIEGDRKIVRDYDVVLQPNNISRTGFGYMVQAIGSWQVPAEHRGTKNNNFVTRTIDSIADTIPNIIQTEMLK